MSINIINPGLINTKIREVFYTLGRGRTSVQGDHRPYHKMQDGRQIPYSVMMGSAPLTRGNELLQKMVEAVPEECTTIIWRQQPEIQQENPFQRAPRIIVRFRLAILNDDGVELEPKQYKVMEGEPPIAIEEYEIEGDKGYVLQPSD